MLDSLYTTLFQSTPRFSAVAIWGAWLSVSAVLAFNAAAALSLGSTGVMVLAIAFILVGLIGWYWLSASVDLLARLLGGQGSGQSTMTAIAQSLWPLLLTAPVLTIKDWLPSLGELLSLLLTLWVLFILIRGIRQAHNLGWGKSVLCFVLTIALAVVAPLGMVMWPFMLIFGT